MTEIRLGREYYHLQQDIGAWCAEQFGAIDFFDKTKNIRWHRDIQFGYQNFTFHRDEDATFFALYWIKK